MYGDRVFEWYGSYSHFLYSVLIYKALGRAQIEEGHFYSRFVANVYRNG